MKDYIMLQLVKNDIKIFDAYDILNLIYKSFACAIKMLNKKIKQN